MIIIPCENADHRHRSIIPSSICWELCQVTTLFWGRVQSSHHLGTASWGQGTVTIKWNELPIAIAVCIYHLPFIFYRIYFFWSKQLTIMILHVFLVSHKNATSNEFNLLDHQKMRPLKFDGWHCVSEYGLHVGIESHSGAAVTCPVVTSGTTVAARTRRQQLQTLDNVKLGSTCYYFLWGSHHDPWGLSHNQAGRPPTHYYTFSETAMPLSESLNKRTPL